MQGEPTFSCRQASQLKQPNRNLRPWYPCSRPKKGFLIWDLDVSHCSDACIGTLLWAAPDSSEPQVRCTFFDDGGGPWDSVHHWWISKLGVATQLLDLRRDDIILESCKHFLRPQSNRQTAQYWGGLTFDEAWFLPTTIQSAVSVALPSLWLSDTAILIATTHFGLIFLCFDAGFAHHLDRSSRSSLILHFVNSGKTSLRWMVRQSHLHSIPCWFPHAC